MSKAVLISIQPKWCNLIATGEKTVEVRKSRPKLETPFKVYIYRTKGFMRHLCGGKWFNMPVGGHVIGEFVCDELVPICVLDNGSVQDWNFHHLDRSCLSYDELARYIGAGKTGCGWHISDLVIYDKPKELSEFAKPGKCPYNPSADGKCTYKYHCFRAGKLERCGEFMERPPQSWCYVEELEGASGNERGL